jgi:pSer/pThr/pTyr-binding forkhead associated (FHA) protein
VYTAFSATLAPTVPETGLPMPSTSTITSIRLIISGAEVVLGVGEHVLGRSADCAVCVEDPLASRQHAAITVTAEQVTIRDLGSRNGVLVNGDEIDRNRVLTEGDLITLGSQALTVLQICRTGGAYVVGFVSSGLGRQPVKSAPLGKIAVTRRAVPEEEALAEALAATTTLSQSSPFGRPVAAFRLIAEAASRAIATNRCERAEKILENPLLEVLSTLRAGLEVEGEILDIAVQQALVLCEITRHLRWADYLHDLFDQLRTPMPLPIADRLALAMQQTR